MNKLLRAAFEDEERAEAAEVEGDGLDVGEAGQARAPTRGKA